MAEADYSRRVRAWIPVPGSTKGRLVDGAIAEFGRRGYEAVSVHELAARAEVTIGSLYHHFGNKLGLYDAVRTDIERRLLDRMEGAADGGASTARMLLVGFDYLVRTRYARLLSEPHPDRAEDPVLIMVAGYADNDGRPVGRLLLAAWRAALAEAAAVDPSAPGSSEAIDAVRAALAEVLG